MNREYSDSEQATHDLNEARENAHQREIMMKEVIEEPWLIDADDPTWMVVDGQRVGRFGTKRTDGPTDQERNRQATLGHRLLAVMNDAYDNGDRNGAWTKIDDIIQELRRGT